MHDNWGSDRGNLCGFFFLPVRVSPYNVLKMHTCPVSISHVLLQVFQVNFSPLRPRHMPLSLLTHQRDTALLNKKHLSKQTKRHIYVLLDVCIKLWGEVVKCLAQRDCVWLCRWRWRWRRNTKITGNPGLSPVTLLVTFYIGTDGPTAACQHQNTHTIKDTPCTSVN